eukprot:tig00021462_g21601.t2
MTGPTAQPVVQVDAPPSGAAPSTPAAVDRLAMKVPSVSDFWRDSFDDVHAVSWRTFSEAFRRVVAEPLKLTEDELHTIRALLGAHAGDDSQVRREAALAAFAGGFGGTCRALAASHFRGFSPSAAAGRPATPSPPIEGPPTPERAPAPPSGEIVAGAHERNNSFRKIERLAATDSLEQLRDSISIGAIVESLESTDQQAQAAKTLGALAQADPMFQTSISMIGGIPPLVRMLEGTAQAAAAGEPARPRPGPGRRGGGRRRRRRRPSAARECALFALSSLARRNGPNQRAIAAAGAVPLLSTTLRDGQGREQLLAAKLTGYLAELPENHVLLRDASSGASCAQLVARMLLSQDRAARDVAGAAMFYITLNPQTSEHLLASSDLQMVRVFAGLLASGDDPVACNSIAVLQHIAAHSLTRERLLVEAAAANVTRPIVSLIKHRPPRISSYGIQLLNSLLTQSAAPLSVRSSLTLLPPSPTPGDTRAPSPSPLPDRAAGTPLPLGPPPCASCDGGAITRFFGRLLGIPEAMSDHSHLPDSPSLPSHSHPRRLSAGGPEAEGGAGLDGAVPRRALVEGFLKAGGPAALVRQLEAPAGRADRRFCAAARALRALLEGGALPPEERAAASALAEGLVVSSLAVSAADDD